MPAGCCGDNPGMITPTASLRTAAISLLFGALSIFAASPTLASSTCTNETFEGARYTVCNPGSAEALLLFWDNQDGAPYRSFSAVADAVAAEGKQLRFAMNAGMYDTNFKPLGLYATDGKEKVRISTAEANPTTRPVPNFLKKPNGVFYVDRDGKAGVLTTEDYLAAGIEARIATQSGPMLVINGALHPSLIPGSTDRTRRSGVGVCKDGDVRFAISEGWVNFDEFARLFRDQLGCENALFLDGGRGVGLYSPDLGRNDFSWHGGFGPMFGIAD